MGRVFLFFLRSPAQIVPFHQQVVLPPPPPRLSVAFMRHLSRCSRSVSSSPDTACSGSSSWEPPAAFGLLVPKRLLHVGFLFRDPKMTGVPLVSLSNDRKTGTLQKAPPERAHIGTCVCVCVCCVCVCVRACFWRRGTCFHLGLIGNQKQRQAILGRGPRF